jgi:hypothetical protein
MLNNPFNHFSVKIVILLAMLVTSVASYGQDPQKAKMSPAGMGYLEYLPAGYSSSTAKYPAIIFLHGSGERGTGTATDLEKVKNQGPPKLIKNGETMCFTVNGKTECFIVLSPQTNRWIWKYDVIPFVQYALQTYRIDPDRVYVTGLSMGGEGTWLTAGLEDNAPNLLAAIGVMCGRGSEEVGCTVAGRKINVWAFHGDADTALGISGGLLPITGMLGCGASPTPVWTVYPGVGHAGCWERGYRTDHMYHNPNLYEWFLTKRRGSAASAPAPMPPTVSAGADKTITLPTSTTTLYGTSSDVDGQIASNQWTKVSGPAGVSLWNSTTKSLSLSGLVAGTYVFRFTATDNSNLQDSDDVTLTVKAAAPTGIAPVVSAGLDKIIVLPASSTTVFAVATDVDGQIASYAWTKVSGPAGVSLWNSTTKALSVSGLIAGTYVFRVTVKDNSNLQATDDVKVTVVTALQ